MSNPDIKLSFWLKLRNAFTDPKVVVVLLGMIGSVSAFGVKLLMEVGQLRASAEMAQSQLNDLKLLHQTEMSNLNRLLTKVIGNCSGGLN